MINVYVPQSSDWMDIKLSKRPFSNEDNPDYDKLVCFEETDKDSLCKFELFKAELRFRIQQYYSQCPSFNRCPDKADEVFWVSVPDPSAVRRAEVISSVDAENQYFNQGNCFFSRKEAEDLLSIINFIIARYY